MYHQNMYTCVLANHAQNLFILLTSFSSNFRFVMYNVARSILHCKPIVLSYNNGREFLETTSLPLKPYHLIAQLAPRYVCQLFNPNMADQPVPEILLREVRKHFNISTPQLYKELRELMDGLSIFAGNNPLVSSVAVLLNVMFDTYISLVCTEGG